MSAGTVARPALLAASLLLVALPARAHNGAVALVVPVEGITLDGEVSDWPTGMRRHPLGLAEYGVRPRDTEDFEGSFRVGYSARESAVYVAVEVRDESTVIDTVAGTWETQDGCEVYVAVDHRQAESPAAQYALYGDKLQVFGPAGRAVDARVRVGRETNTRRYEWRIDLGGLSEGAVQLADGTVLGLDVVATDMDRDGSFSWMAWGKGTGKMGVPANRGDAVLAPLDAPTGILRVLATGEGALAPAGRRKVRVHFPAGTGQWVDLLTHREGAASAELPLGEYRVAASTRSAPADGVAAALGDGDGAVVELRIPPPRGLTTTVRRGRWVQAGPGTRQGPWLTFDASDGLPRAYISGICADGRGGLWLATSAGLVHYDGARFRILTTEDGLPSDERLCIARDRQGNVWFGAYRAGVSRFDGQTLTTFTTEDGLPGDIVQAICQDRQGDMWLGSGDVGAATRYDGQQFVTYGAAEGLGGFGVLAIVEDSRGALWFAAYGASVVRYHGRSFTPFTTRDGLASNEVTAMAEDRRGDLWFGTRDGGVSRFDGHGFTPFTAADGLAGNEMTCAAADGQGGVWFGSRTGGASRWDGRRFSTFTARDGLAAGPVSAISEDGQGGLWLASPAGLSRYDGAWITSFTSADGLVDDQAYQIEEGGQGDLWFSGYRGVSRYDGARFTAFAMGQALPGRFLNTMEADGRGSVWVASYGPQSWLSRFDGEAFTRYTLDDYYPASAIAADRRGRLWVGTPRGDVKRLEGGQFRLVGEAPAAADGVIAIVGDRDGNLWFGTQGGAWRCDGERFATFTTADGLPSDTVQVVYPDRRGGLWVGTTGGLGRLEGDRFAAFTVADGLAANSVRDILEDRQGSLWIATDGGVTRYDGKAFTSYTTQDGLVHSDVLGILEDRDGHLWFYTPGGVSRYDGRVFQRLRRQDGLAHSNVTDLHQDRAGDMWIATLAGVTRYRSRSAPPRIAIADVVADRRYGAVPELRLPSSQELVAFEFQGASLSTSPDQMAYVYRLQGRDPDWRVTREPRVEYADLPVGRYLFEVKAVDRDLNYAVTPAAVRLQVHPPYGKMALTAGLGLAVVGMVVASGYAVRKRRALVRGMEEELQTAHDLQMGLMPAAAPDVAGMKVAGRCVTANHVGGDFYAYFEQGGCFTAALADVTGHAMDAAIPAVMFSGILDKQMEMPLDLAARVSSLNRSLCRALRPRTLVCLSMVDIDVAQRRARLTNAGCPFPLHYDARTGTLCECEVEAYPLGVRPDTAFAVQDLRLAGGDYLIFHSDGFAEAANAAGEPFGFERTIDVMRRACAEGLEPDALIDRLTAAVREFAGGAPQSDDMTCVVVRLEEAG
ncbi:MAG: two-component regulator propeller domain-containing protein [Candidatus Latescibacterota bacterium]